MDLTHRRSQRRSLRLKNFDYSSGGAYFVTVCCYERRPVLGRMEGDQLVPSKLGESLLSSVDEFSSFYPAVDFETFQLMPDHFHAIIFLTGNDISLTEVMQRFKSYTSMLYRKSTGNIRLWQRGYYEHVVRNDKDLNHVREYILNNPLQWHIDNIYRA